MNLFLGHLRFKIPVELPLVLHISDIFPVSHSQTGQVGSSQRCSFSDLRTNKTRADKITLELHEQVVYRGAAINTQFFYLNS